MAPEKRVDGDTLAPTRLVSLHFLPALVYTFNQGYVVRSLSRSRSRSRSQNQSQSRGNERGVGVGVDKTTSTLTPGHLLQFEPVRAD